MHIEFRQEQLFLNFLNIQKNPAHKISSYVHGLKISFLSEAVVPHGRQKES